MRFACVFLYGLVHFNLLSYCVQILWNEQKTFLPKLYSSYFIINCVLATNFYPIDVMYTMLGACNLENSAEAGRNSCAFFIV